MKNNNFKQDLLDDLKSLQHKEIPTLSAWGLYGTLFKYLGIFSLFIISITMLGDYFLIKIGRVSEEDVFDYVMASGVLCGTGWSLFLSLGISSGLQKLIIFNKTIKPLMNTGEVLYKKLKNILCVLVCIYLVVLFISSFIFGYFGFCHFFALLGTIFIGGAFLNGEISRLGIPELPHIIEQISQGRQVHFN